MGIRPRGHIRGIMATTAKKTLDGTVLDRLYKVIESRRGADPAVSNTARLFAKGAAWFMSNALQ